MKTQHEELIDNPKEKEIMMRVAGKSPNAKIAGAIIKYIEREYEVSLVAMGAAAVNQMTKGCIIAKGMLASKGMDMVIVPSFRDEQVDEVTKTAVRFLVRYSKMT